MPKGNSPDPTDALGALLYEARLPLLIRVVGSALLAWVSLTSFWILTRRWQEMGWIALVTFLSGAIVGPYAVLESKNRWVRFHERGLISQGLFGRIRVVPYSDVSFVHRAADLSIGVQKQRSVTIPKWEGDFDRIEEIVKARRPQQSG